MKKTSLLLAVLLAASGAAFAADTTSTTGKASMNAGTSTSTTQSGETLGAKTKRGFHKVGDAFRRAGHRIAHPREGRDSSTSYSGSNNSSSSDANDSGRRQRMDSAYSDWQSKRKS